MRINSSAVLSQLAADLGSANAATNCASAHETALMEVVTDYTMGSSQALDGYRSFIETIRVPAIVLHQDALLTFIADMHADESLVRSRALPLGAVVDTDAVQERIESRFADAAWYEDLADNPFVIPPASWVLNGIASGLRAEAQGLKDRLSLLMEYLQDGSVYANSASFKSRLASSRQALRAVRIDPSTGAYDLTGVDLSWIGATDADYWQRRNRLTLERYLVFDADGNVVGVRSEMKGRYWELAGIGLRCLSETGMPDEMDNLTLDEKYVILWALAHIVGPVQDAEFGTMGAVMHAMGDNPASVLIDAASVLFGGNKIPLITDLVSFTAKDGVFYSTDQPNSIQRRNGFADVTELGGPLLGMDLDTTITTFVYEGREYRLQTWDGSYFSGATYGGEVGLYSRPAPTCAYDEYEHMSADELVENVDSLSRRQVASAFAVYSAVDDEHKPEMMVRVQTGDPQEYIKMNAGKTYWSFSATNKPVNDKGVPQPYTNNEQISVSALLDFSHDPDFGRAVCEALSQDGIQSSEDCGIVAVSWDKAGRD